jgi:hypothetical protein
MPVPHPSQLRHDQFLLQVDAYDEQADTFTCTVHTLGARQSVNRQECQLPAVLMPTLLNFSDEAHNLIGNTYVRTI